MLAQPIEIGHGLLGPWQADDMTAFQQGRVGDIPHLHAWLVKKWVEVGEIRAVGIVHDADAQHVAIGRPLAKSIGRYGVFLPDAEVAKIGHNSQHGNASQLSKLREAIAEELWVAAKF